MELKFNLDKEYRLKEINKLALLLQNTKLKSLFIIREIAESIEILSDDKILNELVSAMEEIKNSSYSKYSKEKKRLKNERKNK